MRATPQQIESVKDWVRYEWVVALVAVLALWAFGEGRWYDDHMRIVVVGVFAALTLVGVLIGMVFPERD